MKNNQKILITGADGFIGSHLTEYLVRCGYKVKAMCMYNSFNSWGWLDSIDKKIIQDIDIVLGDVRDPKSVDNATKGIDTVLHLASLIAIPHSYHSPHSYLSTNISGTLNIMESCLNNNVSAIIHTSTSEVYGDTHKMPISETNMQYAKSPYAATKIASGSSLLRPNHSSINCTELNIAIGFTWPLPARFGVEPCSCSKSMCLSPIFALAAIPIPP